MILRGPEKWAKSRRSDAKCPKNPRFLKILDARKRPKLAILGSDLCRVKGGSSEDTWQIDVGYWSSWPAASASPLTLVDVVFNQVGVLSQSHSLFSALHACNSLVMPTPRKKLSRNRTATMDAILGHIDGCAGRLERG